MWAKNSRIIIGGLSSEMLTPEEYMVYALIITGESVGVVHTCSELVQEWHGPISQYDELCARLHDVIDFEEQHKDMIVVTPTQRTEREDAEGSGEGYHNWDIVGEFDYSVPGGGRR